MPHGSSRWNRCVWLGALAFAMTTVAPAAQAAAKPAFQTEQADLAAACAKLDDPKFLGIMDGLLLKLAVECGRQDLLGQVVAEADEPSERVPEATDVKVNNSAGDSGASRTQNETALASNATTGTICSGFNDSYSGFTLGTDYTGFSSSTNGGASFTDHGPLHPTTGRSFGDPGIVWRKSDGKFYMIALHTSGLAIWRSDDDCATMTYVGVVHSGANDDKELMAVDNNPANPHYGRLYVAWTNFDTGQIFDTYSDNGGATWSTPVALSTSGEDVQGAWPAVAPNGDVYVTWIRWDPPTGYPTASITTQVVRSTDGGGTFSFVTPPLSAGVNPRQAGATSACGRPGLNSNLRYLPSPQIAVDSAGVLHEVYSRDPDGYDTGDVINVYYRRSTNNGSSWGTEVQLNDVGTNDQFFPSISVGRDNIVTAGWYDRRDDSSNIRINYYTSTSYDGGVTWQPDVKVSDVDSPVVFDPNLALCYHGDYDTHVQTATSGIAQWGDDRDTTGGGNNADTYVEVTPLPTDFLVLSLPASQAICAGSSAIYDVSVPSFLAFVDPVTLSASGNPGATTTLFGANPITPGNSTTLTIGNTGSVTAGSYAINVLGSADAGAITHSVNVGLDVYVGAPGASTLSAPADTASNVGLRPTFSWSAASGGQSYLLEVDDDSGFGSPAISTIVSGTTFTAVADLASNSLYYWRVRPSNICSDGPYSTTFSFTTAALPGDCSTGTTQSLFYAYGFESGAGGWTSSGTGNTWASSGARKHTGAASWLAIDSGSVTDQRFVSPPIVLPAGTGISLLFWNYQAIEHNGTTGCYDGGILEVTTNGGGTWTQVTSGLLTDPYDGAVSSCCSNPLVGLQAWCGDPQDWTKSVVSLDSLAGQTVQFRFRLASDSSVAKEGWYLDDVVLQQCVTGMFSDSFETGDFSRWSATGF